MASHAFLRGHHLTHPHAHERQLAHLSSWGSMAEARERHANCCENRKDLGGSLECTIAEFHTAHSLQRREGFRSLGQSVLATEFDPRQSVESLRAHGELEVGVALLTQSIMAGWGNVYKPEVRFPCRVNPFRRVAALSIGELGCVVGTSRKFMLANVTDP